MQRKSSPSIPTLDVDGWTIDDAEVAHNATPETYWIPPYSERSAIGVGCHAKLRFYIRTEDEVGNVKDNGERMWVLVKGRVADWYRGELANQPACTDAISPGLEVWFQARHVIGTETESS